MIGFIFIFIKFCQAEKTNKHFYAWLNNYVLTSWEIKISCKMLRQEIIPFLVFLVRVLTFALRT